MTVTMDKMPDLYALVVKQIFLTKGLSTGFVAMKARSKWSATGVVKIYAHEKRDIEERSFWCQQKEMPILNRHLTSRRRGLARRPLRGQLHLSDNYL
jgi:hypothetical protein